MSAYNSLNIFIFTPENDNEMFVAFDNNRWTKVDCRNECKRRFHPKLKTEDVNDMLIGWNQHCFTVAKEETYTVTIDQHMTFRESKYCSPNA